jgi:BON domain
LGREARNLPEKCEFFTGHRSGRDLVLQQLAWDSGIDASGIGVTAKDGAVTLTGFVDSYPGKLAAERVAKRGARHGVAASNSYWPTIRTGAPG